MALFGFLIDGGGFFEFNLKLFRAAMGAFHGFLRGFDDVVHNPLDKFLAGVLVLGSEPLILQHFFRRQ